MNSMNKENDTAMPGKNKEDIACLINDKPCKDGYYKYDEQGQVVAWVCKNAACPYHAIIGDVIFAEKYEGMTNQEAIETIQANYPPENYTLLREALDKAVNLLKEQEIKPYRFKRVQATYIGMNFETGELNHYDVYECPHCGDEVTKSMAQEWKYCPKCGNPVKWEQ